MDPTCKFEVDVFFLNVVVVVVITLIQIVAALLFKKKKSRHLREIEGDVNVSSKHMQFYANMIVYWIRWILSLLFHEAHYGKLAI